MILIGLGGNLPSSGHGPPPRTLEAALSHFGAAGVRILRRSRWYRSAPLPPSDQPWFVNGVAVIETALPPPRLLALLLDVEARLGRVRQARWGARTADLDLLAYGRQVVRTTGEGPGRDLVLPHPRLHERAFVLVPLAEVAPGWRHPLLGRRVEELLARLPAGQAIEPL